MLVRILGLGARCRSYWVFLLLATALVQGLTPAQQSLASSWGLLRFLSIMDFSDSDGDETDLAEEEWVSTEPERRLDLHLLAGGVEALSTLIPQSIELASLRFHCPHGNLPTRDHLTVVLCRLTC